jgi:hypothetical protein
MKSPNQIAFQKTLRFCKVAIILPFSTPRAALSRRWVNIWLIFSAAAQYNVGIKCVRPHHEVGSSIRGAAPSAHMQRGHNTKTLRLCGIDPREQPLPFANQHHTHIHSGPPPAFEFLSLSFDASNGYKIILHALKL